MSWRPGMPGLPPAGLGQSVLAEAAAGADVAALARGRQGLGDGFTDLVSRATDTDGLVIGPPAPITGVEVVVDPNRTAADWLTLPTNRALGVTPPAGAAVVHVAVGTTAANPWSSAPADRIVDLSAPGLSPESFTVAAPADGEWFVVLAPRADATLGNSDPSGIVGQAARLSRALGALGDGRAVVVIALGGAGHAARLACDATAAVTDLVTLGTPWSPVAFDTLRNGGSGDAVRALRALLPAVDLADPDDDDLALGRALVGTWLDRSAQFELDAPRPTVAVRGGLRVRAWFGRLDQARVQRALTAIVAAGLSLRAQAREPLTSAAPTSAHLALRLPIPTRAEPSGHGVQVSGHVELGLAATPFGTDVVAPSLRVQLILADADGWLIGGPGTTPPPGSAPLEVRFVEATVDVGLGGTNHNVQVVLHEVAALGAWRDRIVVSPGLASGTIEDLPFLPEARAALNAVIQRMRAADPLSIAAGLLAALDGIGLSSDLGLVPDALTHLLHDPADFATSQLTSPTARTALATALATLVPGAARTGDVVTVTSGPATAVLDLVAKRATFSAASTVGALPWQATVAGIGGSRPQVTLTVGSASVNAMAVELDVQPGSPTPFAAKVLTQSSSAAPAAVSLWPVPDADGLVGLLRTALPAEATRLVLDGVRGMDATVATAIDAVADALGLLGAADANGHHPIIAPVGLFRDPGGWLRGHVLGDGITLQADRVIDLFEAIKPFVGLVGTDRGVWPLVPGVSLQATSAAGGASVSCSLDPTAWLGGVGRLPFAAGVTVGLTIGAGGAPHPTVELFAGAPEQPVGTHRKAVHAVLDGTALTVFLRPAAGADIPIFPSAAGLGALMAEGTVDLLLPMALNALAEMSGDATRTQIAALVSAFGKGLDIVNDPNVAPVTFSGTKLHDLADHLADRLSSRAVDLVTECVAALNPLLGQLPGSVSAAMSIGKLVVTVHGVVLTVQPSPLEIGVAGSVGSLPLIDHVSAAFSAGADGIHAWSFGVGPAAFDLGGPVLRPVLRGGRTVSGWEVHAGLALDGNSPTTVGHKELFARWRDPGSLDIVARTRGASTDDDSTDAGKVALFAADAVLELLGNYVIEITEVSAMLEPHRQRAQRPRVAAGLAAVVDQRPRHGAGTHQQRAAQPVRPGPQAGRRAAGATTRPGQPGRPSRRRPGRSAGQRHRPGRWHRAQPRRVDADLAGHGFLVDPTTQRARARPRRGHRPGAHHQLGHTHGHPCPGLRSQRSRRAHQFGQRPAARRRPAHRVGRRAPLRPPRTRLDRRRRVGWRARRAGRIGSAARARRWRQHRRPGRGRRRRRLRLAAHTEVQPGTGDPGPPRRRRHRRLAQRRQRRRAVVPPDPACVRTACTSSRSASAPATPGRRAASTGSRCRSTAACRCSASPPASTSCA